MTTFITMTYRDEAGDYVVPQLLIPMDLVLRPDLFSKLYSRIPSVQTPVDPRLLRAQSVHVDAGGGSWRSLM